MNDMQTRDRSHLTLVVNNGGFVANAPSKPKPAVRVKVEQTGFNPVRLARTSESTACADALVDAYHRERLSTPFRSVIRVELLPEIDRETLGLAIFELESRGWTVSSADSQFDRDVANASALWLKPYC